MTYLLQAIEINQGKAIREEHHYLKGLRKHPSSTIHSKELYLENIQSKKNNIKAIQGSDVESRNFDNLKQSKESIARMKRDMEEIQNLDAVKEYQFIT